MSVDAEAEQHESKRGNSPRRVPKTSARETAYAAAAPSASASSPRIRRTCAGGMGTRERSVSCAMR